MESTAATLPLTETLQPTTQAELAEIIGRCSRERTPVYPLGGQTSLDYGRPILQPGVGVSLAGLSQVIDYPARDMTITVEAGITMARLAEVMAAERQQLPIDVPHPQLATLGGVIATNQAGPRRLGQGTMRDYVIGIRAVDGRGVTFNGGGRVVKNVAGYDFCKLLTGSLGTVGVISQVTLKVRPLPQAAAVVACSVTSLAQADGLLDQLISSRTSPVAVDLVAGAGWDDAPGLSSLAAGQPRLIVALEGTEVEVHWMTEQLQQEWREQGVTDQTVLSAADEAALLRRLTDFPAIDPAGIDPSPLIVKANLLASRLQQFIEAIQRHDSAASIAAHAACGIVYVRFSPAALVTGGETLWRELVLPAAEAAGGNAIILRAEDPLKLTVPVWGNPPQSLPLMQAVKRQFDPHDILNRGRFVYESQS